MSGWRGAAVAAALFSAAAAPPSAAGAQRSPAGLINVPYVSQSEQLCGGAAAAMVLRYWGATAVVAEDFAALVEDAAGGIRVRRLVDAIRTRGWNAEALAGTAAAVHDVLETGRPVIALIDAGRGRFHYVVITSWSDRAVVVQDPAIAPDRVYAPDDFDRAWEKSGRTMILVTPTAGAAAGAARAAAEPAAPPGESAAVSACDAAVARAVVEANGGNASAAEALLTRAVGDCPASSAPLRELAGLRFTQSRFDAAAALAQRAVAVDPQDRDAWRLLGAAAYLDKRPDEALRAWNTIGEPRLDLVKIDGLARARYDPLRRMIDVPHGGLVTADAVDLARRRIDDLPAISMARVDVEPRGGGTAQIDVAVVERPTFPRTWPELAVATARAAVDREAGAAATDLTGFGDVLSASYRWWTHRPKTVVSFAAPGLFGTRAVWQLDASWETQSYAGVAAPVAEHRRHLGLSVSDWLTPQLRWSVASGMDKWDGRGTMAFAEGAFEGRSRDDRTSVHVNATAWGGASAFALIELGANWLSATDPSGWRLIASTTVEAATARAIVDVWPGAGTGHTRAPLLRAHPLLDDGIVAGPAFGRMLQQASIELQRWPRTARFWNVGVAGFVDAAAAEHRRDSTGRGAFADGGVGFRFRSAWLPGTVRVDYAHGLTDGRAAISVGWIK